jgi:hypothetical protein
MIRTAHIRSCLVALASALAACDDAGTGTIDIRAYGESFIEAGIPAEAMADAWSVTFTRFDVQLSDISVAGTTLAGPYSVALASPSDGLGHSVATIAAAASRHADHAFTVDSIIVEGRATLGENSKTFAWTFALPTRYSACDTVTRVRDGATTAFQITVHADHLFADSLVAEELRLVFQPFADADANGDGNITEAELAATDIGSFDPGSDGNIDDLWTWLGAQVRTLGHVDGEGHCDAQAR